MFTIFPAIYCSSYVKKTAKQSLNRESWKGGQDHHNCHRDHGKSAGGQHHHNVHVDHLKNPNLGVVNIIILGGQLHNIGWSI